MQSFFFSSSPDFSGVDVVVSEERVTDEQTFDATQKKKRVYKIGPKSCFVLQIKAFKFASSF